MLEGLVDPNNPGWSFVGGFILFVVGFLLTRIRFRDKVSELILKAFGYFAAFTSAAIQFAMIMVVLRG